MDPIFQDRLHAGRYLSELLRPYARKADLLVLGLATGGVPVAFEVARTIGKPLDVLVVRTLPVPGHEDLTMGTIAAGGVRVLDWETIAELDIRRGTIENVARFEAIELARRERYYRNRGNAPKMTSRSIVLVDDGLTPGSILRDAAEALRAYHPAHTALAVPVLTTAAIGELRPQVDELVVARAVESLPRATDAYDSAAQVSHREVRHLLSEASRAREALASRSAP